MKTKAKPAPLPRKLIKVRLDNRTVITISRLSSLKVWQERFPKAKILPV